MALTPKKPSAKQDYRPAREFADIYPEWFKAWIDRKAIQYRVYFDDDDPNDQSAMRWLDGASESIPSTWRFSRGTGGYCISNLFGGDNDFECGYTVEFRFKPEPVKRAWTDTEALVKMRQGYTFESKTVTNGFPNISGLGLSYNSSIGGWCLLVRVTLEELFENYVCYAPGSDLAEICGVVEE